jgi:hypothetical protein
MPIFRRIGKGMQDLVSRKAPEDRLNRNHSIKQFLTRNRGILLSGAERALSDLRILEQIQSLKKLGRLLERREDTSVQYFRRVRELAASLSPADEIQPIFLNGEFKLSSAADRASLRERIIAQSRDPHRDVTREYGILSYTFETNGNDFSYRGLASPVVHVETLKVSKGLEIAEEECTYKLWVRLMEEDPSLPAPEYMDENDIGINAGENLPVVGVSYIACERAAEILSGITGEEWFIPTQRQLLKIRRKPFVKLYNKEGYVFVWTNEASGMPWTRESKVLLKLWNNTTDDKTASKVWRDVGVRFAKRAR